MAKSLSETAKAILMNEDGGYPSIKSDPSRGLKGEDPKTANAKTLAPGSKSKEEMHKLDTNYGIQDKGQAVVKPTDKNGIFDSSTSKAPKRPADKEGGEKTPVSTSPSSVKEEIDNVINAMIEEGLSEEEILAALSEMYDDEALALVFESEETEGEEVVVEQEETEGEGEEVVAEETPEGEEALEEEKAPVDQFEINLDEHVAALFEGEDGLSEEFKAKAKTIFEAALNEKLKVELAVIEEAYGEQLEEEVESIRQELEENVDKYLNYVVEQWVSDNEVAIESNLRSELTEDFITGLKKLFEENYLDIPEDAVPVVESLTARVEELEASLNEQIESNVELLSQINEAKSFEILVDVCSDLTDTQADRLKSLAEGIRFTNPEEYEAKLLTLKETYFSRKVKNENVIDEQVTQSPDGNLNEQIVQGPMANYVKSLGKVSKNK